MIRLTRLNGEQFDLNPDVIERVESAPGSSSVHTRDEQTYIVTESRDEIRAEFVKVHAEILATGLAALETVSAHATPKEG